MNQEDIDIVLDVFGYNSEHLASMVDNLSARYPHFDRADIQQELEERLYINDTYTSEPDLPQVVIPKEDWDEALQMGDTASIVDYLVTLHPHLTFEEIENELARVSSSRSKKSRKSKKTKNVIQENAINDALEFYSYEFGPDLREKIVKYLSKEYPTLTRREIIDQLKEYEFGSPKKEPIGGSPEQYSLVATPPRRGATYRPSDFSPSSMGACGSDAMDFLEEKRSKYLPTYVSPARSPIPVHGIPTSRRFREHLPSPPRTLRRDNETETGRRRLSFSNTNSRDPGESCRRSRK